MARFSILTGLLVVALTSSVTAQITGVVRDAETDDPIENAIVSVQASDIQTSTNVTGDFELDVTAGSRRVVVAGAKGYFYDSSEVSSPAHLELRLDPVPTADDPSYTFTFPQTCANCHPVQYEEWTGSPMSQAGVNSWVYDIYDGSGTEDGDGGFVYTRDSVYAEENPESECAACHQPEPWAHNPFSALGDYDNPSPAMKRGVACDMCHRIANIDTSKPNFPGIYPGIVTLSRPVGEPWVVMYGVLGDVSFVQPGWMRASYQPQLRSEVCAACHQDKNDPDGDGDFEQENGVVSEPTYLEWLTSSYSDPSSIHHAECVDCHMPPNDETAACDKETLDRPPGDVRSHTLRGTTAEFLENALTLTMTAERVEEAVEIEVSIENDKTGHHVPTGVTIRNMILLVEAWAEDGTPLEYTGTELIHGLGGCAPESGPDNCIADRNDGYYGGLPGRLYGKINIAEDGSSPTFFTDAVSIVSDNRIPALATDTTQHSFAIPQAAGDVKVSARVIYRRSWRALVDAKKWKYDGHGVPLEDIAPPHFGHLMASAEETLEGPDAPSPDGGVPDGGSPDGGSPDGGTATSGGGCSASPVQPSGITSLVALTIAALCATRRRRQSH